MHAQLALLTGNCRDHEPARPPRDSGPQQETRVPRLPSGVKEAEGLRKAKIKPLWAVHPEAHPRGSVSPSQSRPGSPGPLFPWTHSGCPPTPTPGTSETRAALPGLRPCEAGPRTTQTWARCQPPAGTLAGWGWGAVGVGAGPLWSSPWNGDMNHYGSYGYSNPTGREQDSRAHLQTVPKRRVLRSSLGTRSPPSWLPDSPPGQGARHRPGSALEA